jgi:hypothetical protein
MNVTCTKTEIAVSPENPIRGSYLCGGVQFEITGPVLCQKVGRPETRTILED